MTPEERAKRLIDTYRKQTHPEEDPGFDAIEKDIAKAIREAVDEATRKLP